MQVVAFTRPDTDLTMAYGAGHSYSLVIFSVLIAILAAFAAFNHSELVRRSHLARATLPWRFLGALSLGAGVWAMHFLGMLAYTLPVDIDYHTGRTVISVIPAIIAGAITLVVISEQDVSLPRLLTGGVLMGGGIGLMHYIGMSAMILPAERLYDPVWFILSILVAAGMATLALASRPLLAPFIHQRLVLNSIAAVIMGLAVTSMHYVAMHATVFIPSSELIQPRGGVLDSESLVVIALAVAVFVVLVSATAGIMRVRMLRIEQRQQVLEERLYTIAERVPGLVYEYRLEADGRTSFPYASEAIRDIYGVTPQQVRDNAELVKDIIHPDDLAEVQASLAESARTLLPWQQEYRVILPHTKEELWLLGNAAPVRENDGAISWSGVITDITERKKHDELIDKLAYYDTLTGLPNRRLLYQQLEVHIRKAVRDERCGAVFFIDLDKFKRLNDTQGHSAGDNLLRQIAHRMRALLPAEASSGRLSADEFVAVVAGFEQDYQQAVKQVRAIAQTLHDGLHQVYTIDGHEFECAVSIGVCMFRNARHTADEILKRADIAMHEVKLSGGGQWRLFDPAMQAQLEQRYKLELALRQAVEQEELELHLQPQINTKGQIVGAEALLRWHSPEFGMVSPAQFIPLAEETGSIVPIGYWVLEQACAQLTQWQQETITRELALSVNVSARQFYQPDFVEIISQLIAHSGIQPHLLILELTESLVLEDLAEASRRMQRLKQIGLRFSMDDFGTGYSSLSYLAQLPFDEVKIDQSFLRTRCESLLDREWVIVEAIIQLARKLGMTVVAEGVETQLQLKALTERQCPVFQGFYFSRPLNRNAFAAFVHRQPLSISDQAGITGTGCKQ